MMMKNIRFTGIALIQALLLLINITAFGQYQVLHEFAGTDGSYPRGDLVTDSVYLYGMTTTGGTDNGGTIFRIRTDGTGFQKLHDFADSTGMSPDGSLIVSKGILYGVAGTGGDKGGGVIFSIDTAGQQYKVLHSFATDSVNGFMPSGTLLLYDNTLYGMTAKGGVYTTHGVIYKINTDGTYYEVMYGADQPDYCRFGDRLTYFRGYLYGMISEGQSNSSPGAVFRIGRAGYGFATIFDFSIDNGEKPLGFPIIFDSIVYGMTSRGGPDSAGVVFRMELNGLFFNLLRTFNTAEPGGFPQGSLVNDSSIFYGMARGSTPETGCIFRVNSDGTNYSLLYQFQDANNGYYPDGSMLLYGKKLWGMTERGGAADSGVIFTYSLIAQSVQEMNNLPEVTIFPNPASDYTRITSSKDIFSLTLSDMNGRIILEQDHPGKSATITTTGLPVGIYILRLTGRDYTVTRKIVRN